MLYRQLDDNDASSFKKLLKVFADAFDDIDTYQGAVPRDEYLAALLAKPHIIALVAETEAGEIVGGLVAYVLEKFERERAEVYIYDLAVTEPYRRQGIATTLINTLKPIAKKHGAQVIFVQADRGDEPAIKLYESLGTREDVHHFDISAE